MNRCKSFLVEGEKSLHIRLMSHLTSVKMVQGKGCVSGMGRSRSELVTSGEFRPDMNLHVFSTKQEIPWASALGIGPDQSPHGMESPGDAVRDIIQVPYAQTQVHQAGAYSVRAIKGMWGHKTGKMLLIRVVQQWSFYRSKEEGFLRGL